MRGKKLLVGVLTACSLAVTSGAQLWNPDGDGSVAVAAHNATNTAHSALFAAARTNATSINGVPVATVTAGAALGVTSVQSETDPDLAAQNADTLDPTGFADPTAVTVTYNTNRTITLTQAGGVDVWWRGTNFTLSSPWTSTAHATNYTGYYLSFSTGTNATWSTDAWTLDKGQIAYVQYAAAYKLAWRETHGMGMDWRTHEELHRNIGTYRVSGLTPVATTYSVNGAGSANSNNTPGFASGTIQDEDCPTTIDAWPEDLYTTLHFTGSGTPVFTTNATSFVRVTGTYPNVNAYSSGTFSEAETVQNRWLNYYAAFLPMASDSVSQRYRVIIIQPQVAHSSLTAAQAEDYRSLQLAGLTALGPEMIAFVRFTFRTSAGYSTTGKVRIESVTYLTGSQGSQTVITSLVTPSSADAISVSTTPTNYTREANNVESALTGIDAAVGAHLNDPTAAHAASAISVAASGFDGNLSVTDTTMQQVAQKVDDLVADFSMITGALARARAPQAVTYTGTNVYTDATLGGVYRINATNDFYLHLPTGATDGQSIKWWIKQHVGGTNTMTMAADFVIPVGATTPVLSVTNGCVDVLLGEWDGVNSRVRVQSFMRYEQ